MTVNSMDFVTGLIFDIMLIILELIITALLLWALIWIIMLVFGKLSGKENKATRKFDKWWND